LHEAIMQTLYMEGWIAQLEVSWTKGWINLKKKKIFK
jgi:hypothetical protein